MWKLFQSLIIFAVMSFFIYNRIGYDDKGHSVDGIAPIVVAGGVAWLATWIASSLLDLRLRRRQRKNTAREQITR